MKTRCPVHLLRRGAAAGLLFCATLLPASLLADMVLLRSGQSIEGDIVGQSRTEVRIRKANGQVDVIQKANIQRVIFNDPAAQKAAEEERRRKEEENRRAEEARRAEDARKAEEARRAAEAKKADDARAAAEAKKNQDKGKDTTTSGLERAGSVTVFGAAWRAAALPGWGYAYMGDKTKSYAWGGGTFGTLLAAGVLWKRSSSAHTAYNDGVLQSKIDLIIARNVPALAALPDAALLLWVRNGDEALKNAYQKKSRQANIGVAAFGLIYAAQITFSSLTARGMTAVNEPMPENRIIWDVAWNPGPEGMRQKAGYDFNIGYRIHL